MLLGLIGTVLGKVFGIIDKVVPDTTKANELKGAIQKGLIELSEKELQGQIDIILAEARGSWLQRNWRPMLMLVVVLIIANNFLLAPYAAWITGLAFPTLPLPDHLWTLMTVGVGGYIGGRSAEKFAQAWKGTQVK